MYKQHDAYEKAIIVRLLNFCIDITHEWAFTRLNPDEFGNTGYKELFSLMRERYINNQDYDYFTMIVETTENQNLRMLLETIEQDIGNPVYFITEEAINTIKNYHLQNNLLNKLHSTFLKYKNSNEINPELLLNDLENIIENAEIVQSNGNTISQAVDNYFYSDKQVKYIKTNIPYMDGYLNGGFRAGTLVTIVGEPGVGKTYYGMYLLSQILENSEEQGLFFSLEMQEHELIERFISLKAKKFSNLCSEDEIGDALTQIKLMPLKIYDANNAPESHTIEYITMASKIENSKKKVSVILVDYLSIVQIKNSFEADYLRVTEIVRQLTRLAIQLNCVVILLGQANRGPEKRSAFDRAPLPYDEAGSQASYRSSAVWFGIDSPSRHAPNDPRADNLFVVRCAKNRHYKPFYVSTVFQNGAYSQSYHYYDPSIYVSDKTTTKNNYS